MPEAKVILVVEDELPVRKFISEVLEDSGYTVIGASSAPDAIHALSRWKRSLDLLLTDIELGRGMSGIELAKHLESERPNLRVLLMSGSPQHVAALANSDPFLQKPFAPARLLDKIEEVLSLGDRVARPRPGY
jgi:CheY-like chemotaxis protein